MTRTATQRLADQLLGEPVEQWIAALRTPSSGPKMSWNRIAMRLWSDTDRKVLISGQTVQTWAEAATREEGNA